MKHPWKAKLLTALLCNLFLAGTVLYFAPMEVYVGNLSSFVMPFEHVWWIMLAATLLAALLLTAVEMLLPRKVSLLLNALTAGLGLGCYVQSMFLNGGMVTLTGEEMNVTPGQITVNLVIWGAILLAVLAATIVLLLKKKEQLAHNVLRYVSAALTGIQALALVTLIFTSDLSGGQLETFLTGNGQFELSKGENVVVFILDTSDVSIVNDTLAQYPELHSELSGFTYFPNATSAYSRTFPSLTYMLTGERFYFNEDPALYVDRAFTNGTLLRDMHAAGTDVRIYTEDIGMIGNAASDIIANSTAYAYNQLENLSLPGLVQGMGTISLYKLAPYALKDEYEYDPFDIGAESMTLEETYFSNLDCDFYYELADQTLTATDDYKKAFRFYHLWGNHPGYCWDANLEFVYDYTPLRTDAMCGSLRMVAEYVRQMKALGIYDQSTIVITADHGYSGGGDSLDLPQAAAPLMMVKPAGAADAPLAISSAPVCHEDLPATYLQGLSIDAAAYGRTLLDIPEGEARQRTYCYTALFSDEDGEIALREYLVNGDAQELASYQPTGNWWDVAFSMANVSEKSFEEWLNAQ